MAVFDSTVLLYLLEPDARAPHDPATGAPVTDARQRIEHLIETLERKNEVVVIPTPVLSEVLVRADGAGPEYLKILNDSRRFRIAPFDQRAAVELAAITRAAIDAGDLRAGSDATRTKLKFDRQILAIARVQNQSVIYSDDGDIARHAKAFELKAISIRELSLEGLQGTLEFVARSTT